MLSKTTSPRRKRKRSQESKDQLSQIQEKPIQKRLRTSLASRIVVNISSSKAKSNINNDTHSINYWIKEGSWPKEYFEQDKQLGKYLQQKSAFEEVKHENQFREQFEEFKNEDWFKEKYEQVSNMSYLLARQKFLSSLRHKNSKSSMTTSSDQQSREAKSAKYRIAIYSIVLATKGSFMNKFDLGITNASKNICRTLLYLEQTIPLNLLFRNNLFDKTCRKIQDKNKAKVIQDISRLIVPFVEILVTYSAAHLDNLIEGVNKGQNNAIPFYDSCLQFDYFVRFERSAFTNKQLKKLKFFVGEITNSYTFYFIITWRMYFLFLTCEIKCDVIALDVADRQNAYSITFVVREIVELYKTIKRKKELYREILVFSISHNYRIVRIYNHYAIIEEDKIFFYCYYIKTFDFTSEEGKDKWTSFSFTKNVYDKHKLALLKRIRLVVDNLLASIDFGLSQLASFLKELEPQSSQQSNTESISLVEKDNSQSSLIDSQDVTSNTSFSQRIERFFKKPKTNDALEQQQRFLEQSRISS